MTPRPFHCWKSFWLGLLVMGFMAVAWSHSMHFDSWARWRDFWADNGGGGVYLRRVDPFLTYLEPSRLGRYDIPDRNVTAFPMLLVIWGAGKGLPIEQVELHAAGEISFYEPEGGIVPVPESYRERLGHYTYYSVRQDWLIFIPHWLILLAFTLPWSAFLIWRTRRQSKLT